MKIRIALRLLLIAAMIPAVLQLGIAPANATTTSFPCGTSGTYEVDDATFEITGNTLCVGALTIDSSVTAIGSGAFSGNTNLTDIVIPASVITIGASAFNNSIFRSVTLNEGLVTIGGSAFANGFSRSQSDLVLPNSVTSIAANAFSQARFRSISIGENVTSLGQGAFYNNFSGGPSSIVFRGTSAITSIADYTFIGYRGTELILPPNITSIGARPFELAPSLSYLVIPTSVTSLGNEIFKNMSSLRTLILPDSLATIGTNGFASTTGVNTIIYCGSSPTVLNYAYPNSLRPVCAKAAIFNNNGGSGTMRTDTATATSNLSPNTFTKFSSIFTGWNTKADGSGTSYSDNASFSFTTNVVLYAQWSTVTAPGAPTIGTSSVNNSTSASVIFSAPASNGGAIIDYYQCVSSPASMTVTLTQSGSGTCVFDGLTTGTAYQFKVRAHNSAGFSSYSSLSSAVTPSNAAGDPEAVKQEAERKRQQEVDSCKSALKAALASNARIEPGTFAKCGYRTLTQPSEVTVVTKLQALPVDSRTADSVLTAIITKIGVYEDLQGANAKLVTPQQLMQAGIIEAHVPNKTVITLKLQRLDETARDTISEIDAFIAIEAKKMQDRKERLTATIARIQSR